MNLANDEENIKKGLEQVTTFGELRRLLPCTGIRKVPGIEQLNATATVVLQSKTDSGLIKVYDNGFYTYTENGHSTVYGVDRCNNLTWRFCNDETDSAENLVLDNLPWEMPLEIAGTNRLDHNGCSRQDSRVSFSLDAPESANNIKFSTKPEHDLREVDEEAALNRKLKNQAIARELAKLSKAQRNLLEIAFYQKTEQKEIALRLGINPSNVSRRIKAIRRRFKKFL